VNLAAQYQIMYKQNKSIRVLSQSKLFKKLSALMTGHALATKNTGELLKVYSGGALKYYKNEHDPLVELYNFRNKQDEQYKSQESSLNSKKNNIFNKGEAGIPSWDSSTPVKELVGRSHQLLKDKHLAYPFMFTNETKKVQESKERVNFFTN